MDEWKYKRTLAYYTREELDRKLNALVARGWEVVSIDRYERVLTPTYTHVYYQATLKRRKH